MKTQDKEIKKPEYQVIKCSKCNSQVRLMQHFNRCKCGVVYKVLDI
jgi:ribosomal protein S27AE